MEIISTGEQHPILDCVATEDNENLLAITKNVVSENFMHFIIDVYQSWLILYSTIQSLVTKIKNILLLKLKIISTKLCFDL